MKLPERFDWNAETIGEVFGAKRKLTPDVASKILFSLSTNGRHFYGERKELTVLAMFINVVNKASENTFFEWVISKFIEDNLIDIDDFEEYLKGEKPVSSSMMAWLLYTLPTQEDFKNIIKTGVVFTSI